MTTRAPSSAPRPSSGPFVTTTSNWSRPAPTKTRQSPGPTSARAALAIALSVQLRLLAPFVPFVTEEVWSWWHEGSIHRSPWPDARELAPAQHQGDIAVLDMAAAVLGEVRRAKTTRQVSMRAPVAKLTVVDDPERLTLLGLAESDLRDAGGVDELVIRPGPPEVIVEFAPAPDGHEGRGP